MSQMMKYRVQSVIKEQVAQYVAHLGEVDGLGCQGRQPLPPVPVGLGVGGRAPAPRLGPHSVLEVHFGTSQQIS